MDREGIRQLAAERLELLTSRYAFAETLNEMKSAIDGVIGYPCVVKPVMSSSGKGQSVVIDPQQVAVAWEHAMAGGRVAKTKVIVEEMVDFDYEVTLLTVRALGDSGQVETHFCDPIGHVQVQGDYVESWQPQAMSPKALLRARAMAGMLTAELGGRGIFGVEFFVKGDQVWFSEVSPRPHDTGMVTMASQVLSEFELHARAILGLPVTTALRSPGASAVIYGRLQEAGIAFEGVDEALSVPDVDVRLFGKPESFAKRRMGVVVARGEDVSQARQRAQQAAAKIRAVSGA
jgi:phosphoribosylglycinamide formyltransferase 2